MTAPTNWLWTTVGEAGDVDLGRQRHPDWHTGPEMRPYLRVANVFEDRIDTTDLKEMDFSGCFERYKLHPGDVLLNEGQTPELLGRPAIYRGQPQDIAFTNTLIRFRPHPGVTSEWALLVFRHHMHSGRFARESRITTNIAHLSSTRLKSVEFPVPPLPDQRRIVAILDEHLSALSTGVASLQRGAIRLEGLRRSELARSFGAVSGDAVPLGTLISSITAGRSFGSATRPATSDEWGIIRVNSMTRGTFLPELNKFVSADKVDATFEVRPGDLLVSRANTSEYVGASVLVPTDVRPRLLLSDKSMRVTPRPGVDAEWLWRVLQSPSSRRQMSDMASGTKDSMRNISQSSLRSVIVPFVDIREQRLAVEAFQSTEDQVTRQALTIDRLLSREQSLRRAVLAAAFSGRLTGRSSDSDVIQELAHQETA